MEKGLAIQLPQAYTSDLVYLQEASLGKPNGLDAPRTFHLTKDTVTSSDPFTVVANLSWESSAGARSYRVVVAESPDLSKPFAMATVIDPSLSIATLPPQRTFYWKVEAVGWGGRQWNAGDAGMLTIPKAKELSGVTFVSDMPWARATAGAENPVRRDANYFGKPVSLAGKVYRKAVWTHAFPDATPADVVLDISGKNFGTFAATVGLDSASGGGSVQFQVLVDGQLKAESATLQQGHVHAFQVDVTGAKAVTLRVLNGGDGYASDHAAWGYARFVHVGATDPMRKLATEDARTP
jgi:hypothetical protein